MYDKVLVWFWINNLLSRHFCVLHVFDQIFVNNYCLHQLFWYCLCLIITFSKTKIAIKAFYSFSLTDNQTSTITGYNSQMFKSW